MTYKPIYRYGLGNLIQNNDAAENTFVGALIASGKQFRRNRRGVRAKQELTGRKFFAYGAADHYREDPLYVQPILNKYGFSYSVFIQLPAAADNVFNIVPESTTAQDKRQLKMATDGGHYIADHGAHHWGWLYAFPLFDGVNTPSNDDFRVERSDGTNAFGYDVDMTLDEAYTTTITSDSYLDISFGATTFRNLSEAECEEIRRKVSFWTAISFRYKQDMLKVYDELSNLFCGTTGYSVVNGDYTTRTPNTDGGVYPSESNRIKGGVFQGSATLCNHEVWERIQQIYKMWSAIVYKRSNNVVFWGTPTALTPSFYYFPVDAEGVAPKYADRDCTKKCTYLSKHTSSITGENRSFMDVLRSFGYKSTMAAGMGFAQSQYDGYSRKEAQRNYKFNSSISKADYLGDGYIRSFRILDYKLVDEDVPAWNTVLASTNVMKTRYEQTKAIVGSSAIAQHNNFAQVIETMCKEIAWGIIPNGTEDFFVGVTNTTQRNACAAIAVELLCQFCSIAGIKIVAHEEALQVAYTEITAQENLFPNPQMVTTVKDIIQSELCDDMPDGWSAGEVVDESGVRVYSTSERSFTRQYLIQHGTANLTVNAKGKGSIKVYKIRNAHMLWLTLYEPASACQYELACTIPVDSVDYSEVTGNFSIPDEPLKTYTTETEDWRNYFNGTDDKICGLHIEVVPDAGESITIKSPSLIVS